MDFRRTGGQMRKAGPALEFLFLFISTTRLNLRSSRYLDYERRIFFRDWYRREIKRAKHFIRKSFYFCSGMKLDL